MAKGKKKDPLLSTVNRIKEVMFVEEDNPIDLPRLTTARFDFSGVAGLEGLKEALREDVIYPIKHPEISKYYKQRMGSGVLIYGPPGCGKTHVVEALAGEIGWPFIDASCANLIARYAGQTENNIHRTFESARQQAKFSSKGVILFLDEIDALGLRRDHPARDGGFGMMVSTLLSELDGISKNEKVFVVGATNAPWAVDPALKRPGRFDSCIFVPPPDRETRIGLLRIYAGGLPLAEDVDYDALADRTEGYSSADIREICDSAAEIPWKHAIKTKKARRVGMEDFESAIAGTKSSLMEWYALVKNGHLNETNRKMFPELADSVKRFFECKDVPEKTLRGYG